MLDFAPISLDIETSTSSPETGSTLSIAMVNFYSGDSIYLEIFHNLVTVSPESMRINKLDVTKLDLTSLYSKFDADLKMLVWLKQQGNKKPIPMGMNVGTFDMSFVRKDFPETAKYLGYRSIDLNSLLFAKAYLEQEKYEKTKKEAKRLAFECVKKVCAYEPHYALFDALSNCYVFSTLVGKEFNKENNVYR